MGDSSDSGDGPADHKPESGTLRLLASFEPLLSTVGSVGGALGIVALGISSFTLFAYAFLVVAREVWDTISGEWPNIDDLKHLEVVLIEVTDVFLLAAVLNLLAVGFAQLFFDYTDSARIPAWLRVTNLDQLKNKLVGVLAVLLGVTFTAKVVEWTGGTDVFYLGLAIAAVMLALGMLSNVLERGGKGKE
jgi:uncharacterized membrane protein YqhA